MPRDRRAGEVVWVDPHIMSATVMVEEASVGTQMMLEFTTIHRQMAALYRVRSSPNLLQHLEP